MLVLLASVQASLPSRRQEIALCVWPVPVSGTPLQAWWGVFILGLLASLAALIVSEAILYWLQVRMFKLDYASVLWPWIWVPLLASSLIAGLGGFYCRQLVTVAPATILREQSR